MPTEWSEVERTLLLQLSDMGWDVMQGLRWAPLLPHTLSPVQSRCRYAV